MSKKFSIKSLAQLLEEAFDLAYFHADEGETEPAIPYLWVPGTSKLVVVVGENASGKSFLRRIVSGLSQRAEVECLRISMEGRADNGLSMHPIARAMVYGDETYNSTGQLSAHTVTAGINTCRSREKPHFIYWDEPDFGLSDGWAAGLGEKIREFAATMPEHTMGAFVVTHRRAMVRQMMPANPHYVYLGSMTPPTTLQEWLDTPSPIRDIATLDEIAHARFKRIQKILDRK